MSMPDHWACLWLISVAAVKAGKGRCEKPLTRSIAEGRLLSDWVTKHKRVFRTDSEFRSLAQFHRAVELVAELLDRQAAYHPHGRAVWRIKSPPYVKMDVPAELNYDLWQGPAPVKPYTEKRVHPPRLRAARLDQRPRLCDGMIQNRTAHLNESPNGATTPTARGRWSGRAREVPPPGNLWNVCANSEFDCTLPTA